jgi:RNA polymerase sigma-70 factor (ECF subfamily)
MDSPGPRQASIVEPARASTEPPRGAASPVFREIFERELAYVFTALRRLGIADADREDLASEVFFRVHQRLDDLDPDRPIKPWLFAFALRVASEHRRRARHRHEELGGAGDAAEGAVAPAAAGIDEADLVATALEALDLDKRAVLVMHDLDEESVPEIARALGIPEGTAYTRLRAARAQFTAAVRRLQKREP